MKKSFAVIGLGRFGSSVAKNLALSGQEVLAIDSKEERVTEFANIVTHAVVANATDESTLKSLGIRNFDTVVIAIGEDIQASILVTLMVKEMGVQNVWVKAQNDYHARVLEKLGADKVVHPERDMGTRIAYQLVAKNLLEYLQLSDKFSMVEIRVTNKKFVNKTLEELNFTGIYGVNVAAIRRENGQVEIAQATSVVHERDNLLMIGATKDVELLDEKL